MASIRQTRRAGASFCFATMMIVLALTLAPVATGRKSKKERKPRPTGLMRHFAGTLLNGVEPVARPDIGFDRSDRTAADLLIAKGNKLVGEARAGGSPQQRAQAYAEVSKGSIAAQAAPHLCDAPQDCAALARSVSRRQ